MHRKPTVDDGISLNRAIQSGPLRGLEGPRANTKSRPHKLCRLCKGDLGVHPPGNSEILHALKCVLGVSEASFCACIHTKGPCFWDIRMQICKLDDLACIICPPMMCMLLVEPVIYS